MKRNRLNLPWSLLAGLLLLATLAEGLKGTALVISKLKQNQGLGGPVAESRSSEEEPGASSTESSGDPLALSASGGDATNATTKSPLTGIPQKDYVHDPNLPKELNGYNLTNYPFYERVPDDIDFKCDGLHDGFYASIPHKCQVYHHCLFGTRYDFLCANFTAFDQKTFICHFVSEVDCVNSAKYFKRNEALYKEASTTVATTTTAATQPPPLARRPAATRRRRPYRRRPADYYYEDEYADDAEYYDDEVPAHRSTAAPLPAGNGRRRKRPRPRPVDDDRYYPASAPSAPLDHEDPQPETDLKPRPSMSVYERPRVPPKVRRPVPVNERDKYDYTTRKPGQIPATGPQETVQESYPRTKPQARPLAQADDYYDDEEEYVQPARGSQQGSSRAKNPDYYPPTATDDRDIVRRPTMTGAGRPLRRNRPAGAPRRRPAETSTAYAPLPLEGESEDYEEPYEQEPRRPVRPVNGVRKRPQQGSVRQDEYQRPAVRPEPEYTQSNRPAYRGGQSTRYEDEEDTVDVPVAAPRPAYISTAPGGSSSSRPVYRKRVHQQPEPVDDYLPSRPGVADTTPYRRPAGHRKQPARQPAYAEDEEVEYYDDEELPEETPQHNYRNRPKQPQRASQTGAGSYRQPVNPLPPPPQSKVNAQIEDDEVIPQRSGNGNRPFLPSRGGNPTLPRGLQTVGVKAPQTSPRLGASDVDQDLPVKVSQPLSTSSYRPKLEDDYVQPSQPRQSSLPKPNAPSIADALTSRPVAVPQSTYRSTGSKYSQIDSREDEQPSRVQSGNTEYRSKIVEDVQPRVPTSTSGTLRTKQTATSNVGDTSTRNANGKYRPSAPDTTVQRNPSSAPISGQSSSSGYRPKPDDISTAKTSPPLYNIREDSNTNRQQQPQSIKTLAVVTEDIRSALPSAISKPQPSFVVYRSPAKPSTNPPPRLPDLPARTNLADIDESEYDVTLNDALHPTLHPTRSVATGIVSFPQQSNLQRVQVFKTKIGSPSSSSFSSSSSPRREAEAVSNDPSSSLTGGRGYLVGSASQRYITREPYTSLSVHSKDPGLAVVESNPRDGQLAYLHQQDDPVVYHTQHSRKRRPAPQYEDEQTSQVAVNPPRYTRADSQYQRGGVNRESLPLYLDDDTSYSNDRHRQSWSHQQRRRDSNADYVAQY